MNENINPLVAIVIPNYNNEKYLTGCLNSVLAQTYSPIEIVVVDDCSTDASREIINDFVNKTDKIRPVYLTENKGVSNARNTGAKICKAEYITFLDADDFYVSPDKLKNEMAVLLNCERSGRCTAVFSRLQAVDNMGCFLWNYKTKKKFSGNKLRRYILEESGLQLPRDYCMKKQWFIEVGQYEYGNSLYEDLEFLFRLSVKVDFLCTEKLGSVYRITNQGLSSVSREKHKEALNKMRKKFLVELSTYDKMRVYTGLVYNKSIVFMKRICKVILATTGLRKRGKYN